MLRQKKSKNFLPLSKEKVSSRRHYFLILHSALKEKHGVGHLLLPGDMSLMSFPSPSTITLLTKNPDVCYSDEIQHNQTFFWSFDKFTSSTGNSWMEGSYSFFSLFHYWSLIMEILNQLYGEILRSWFKEAKTDLVLYCIVAQESRAQHRPLVFLSLNVFWLKMLDFTLLDSSIKLQLSFFVCK